MSPLALRLLLAARLDGQFNPVNGRTVQGTGTFRVTPLWFLPATLYAHRGGMAHVDCGRILLRGI